MINSHTKEKNTPCLSTDYSVIATCCKYAAVNGLEPETEYTVKPLNIKLHGNTLMNAGIPIINEYSDFNTAVFELTSE